MPKAKNPLTAEQQRKRFEDEVKKQIADGDFDRAAADKALDALVRKNAKGP